MIYLVLSNTDSDSNVSVNIIEFKNINECIECLNDKLTFMYDNGEKYDYFGNHIECLTYDKYENIEDYNKSHLKNIFDFYDSMFTWHRNCRYYGIHIPSICAIIDGNGQIDPNIATDKADF